LFNQRKHKKFSYKSRFSKQDHLAEDSQGNKFTSKWDKERNANLVKNKRSFSLKILILVLVLLLICIY
jgi:hypothetical protein